jgi:LytS/YehU family sensor histidine kinase
MTVVISVMFILFFRQHQLKTLNKSIILEQKILRAQLNPHFIFNALGAIQHYISLQASDKAALYLSKFSKLMRAVLESSRTGTNSLSNELEALKNYLDLQSLRFSGPFSYTIVVDNLIEPDLVYLPSLIMQPLVENAVEHGLLPKEGGELSINISQVNERIKIQVEDDGVGIDNTEHEATHGRDGAGLGMLITRERLALLNKQNIHFEVVNRTQYNPSLTGTIASLELPLIT